MAQNLQTLAEQFGLAHLDNWGGISIIEASDDSNPAEGLSEVAVGHLAAAEVEDFEAEAEDFEVVHREESVYSDMAEWVVVTE